MRSDRVEADAHQRGGAGKPKPTRQVARTATRSLVKKTERSACTSASQRDPRHPARRHAPDRPDRGLREERTDVELDDFGPNLRSYLEEGLRKKEELLRRVAWPVDPLYDLRAFQRSGIAAPTASA